MAKRGRSKLPDSLALVPVSVMVKPEQKKALDKAIGGRSKIVRDALDLFLPLIMEDLYKINTNLPSQEARS